MTRSILLSAGQEHPDPCEDWKKVCKEGKVSFVWYVCGCSPCERNYKIKENGEWTSVKKCPFCGKPINKWYDDNWFPNDRAIVVDLNNLLR